MSEYQFYEFQAIDRSLTAKDRAERKRLQTLATRTDALCQEVHSLIALKQSGAYDKAIRHLEDLRDVAAFQGNTAAFQAQIQQLRALFPSRRGLLSRLQKAGF